MGIDRMFLLPVCSHFVLIVTMLCLGFFHPEMQVKMWVQKYGWRDHGTGEIFISNQEDQIKTKNITEKITFDSKWHVHCDPN